MYKLFALSSNKAVRISFSWRGFRKRGKKRRDGWGVAWYLDDGLVGLVKEPRPSVESPIARLIVRGVKSKIVISHAAPGIQREHKLRQYSPIRAEALGPGLGVRTQRYAARIKGGPRL